MQERCAKGLTRAARALELESQRLQRLQGRGVDDGFDNLKSRASLFGTHNFRATSAPLGQMTAPKGAVCKSKKTNKLEGNRAGKRSPRSCQSAEGKLPSLRAAFAVLGVSPGPVGKSRVPGLQGFSQRLVWKLTWSEKLKGKMEKLTFLRRGEGGIGLGTG